MDVADGLKWMDFEWTALRGADRVRDRANFTRRPRVVSSRACPALSTTLSSAMASATLVKKAFTLPPTVRALATGVPSASLLNLHARPGAHDEHAHAHGEVGPRHDVPARFASSVSLSSSGLLAKNYAVRTSLCLPRSRALWR